MNPSFRSTVPGSTVTECPLRCKPTAHWIEIELLMEDGTPVAGERYWIQLTDGSSHFGNLDERGRARYDGIDAGICQVSFPDMDGMDWSGGEKVGPDQPDVGELPPRAWIGVRLLDDGGEPVKGERYTLKLPDSKVEEGVLDEYGTVYYGDLDPGSCELSFPDLPGELWS